VDIQVVAQDLWFPEGPVALEDGSVLLVEIRRQTLTRVFPDGRTEVVAEIPGGPNGAAIGPDGACYVVNNGGFEFHEQPDGRFVTHGHAPADYNGGSVQRVDLRSGKVETLYTECDGRRLNGPNDLVFDREGGFWFTDPGKVGDGASDQGQLFYAKADGSLIRRFHTMTTPNGVGLSPDQKTLYVAETLTARVHLFEIVAPGQIAPPAAEWDRGVMGPLPGKQMLDSLAVEADGRVCVGTLRHGGITVFSSKSGAWEHIPFPDAMVTNICFGGADMRDAWITGSDGGRLFRCRWPRPGLKLNYNA
jgi:gluconolactonase